MLFIIKIDRTGGGGGGDPAPRNFVFVFDIVDRLCYAESHLIQVMASSVTSVNCNVCVLGAMVTDFPVWFSCEHASFCVEGFYALYI